MSNRATQVLEQLNNMIKGTFWKLVCPRIDTDQALGVYAEGSPLGLDGRGPVLETPTVGKDRKFHKKQTCRVGEDSVETTEKNGKGEQNTLCEMLCKGLGSNHTTRLADGTQLSVDTRKAAKLVAEAEQPGESRLTRGRVTGL